jgi:uncharacterized protein (TIGR00369 family)
MHPRGGGRGEKYVSEKVNVDLEALKEHANQVPFYKLIGMTVEEAGPGYSRFRLPFRQELTQPMGVMHGGALAAVADSAVAIALWGLVGMDRIFTTIEMKINFIGPVGSGEVIAEGNIIHCGRMTAVGDVVLKDMDGRLVGKCVATYMILPTDGNNASSPIWNSPGEMEEE